MIDVRYKNGCLGNILIALGIIKLPFHYAADNIFDFMSNSQNVGFGERVAFERLQYFPIPDKNDGLSRISLEDDTGKLEVLVNPYEKNFTGRSVQDDLDRTQGGERINFPMIICGINNGDKNLYLWGFFPNPPGNKKREKPGLLDKIKKLIPQVSPGLSY